MKSSVLFLVFNRPDTAKQVFEAIRQAKPPRLYIAADGPRENKLGEREICEETRRIATGVDWTCEVKTLFRDKNLGCGKAVSQAITWFFENEEEGIILEDDCLPSSQFFEFCDLMVDKYRMEKKILMISGFNPFGGNVASNDYFHSKNPSVWGWACWRDRWKDYDFTMKNWTSKSCHIFKDIPWYTKMYYCDMFNNTKNGKIDTWDYQLSFQFLSNDQRVIKPISNLIRNIGVIGSHAKRNDANHLVKYGTIIDIANMQLFKCNQDEMFYKKHFIIYPLKRVVKKLLS